MKNQDITKQFTTEQQEVFKEAHKVLKETEDKLIIKLIKSTINSIISTYKSIPLIPSEEKENLLDAISKYFQNLTIITDTLTNNSKTDFLNLYLINPETGYPYIVEQNRSLYGNHYEAILNTIHNIESLESKLLIKKGRIKYYAINNQEITLYIAEYKGTIMIITVKTSNSLVPTLNINKIHQLIKKQIKTYNPKIQEIYNLIVDSEFDLNYIYQKSSQYYKKDAF